LIATALILVGLVVTFLQPFVRSMSSTLRKLTEIAKEVSSGHFGKTLDVHRTDELGTLVQAINDMSGKLEEAEKLNTRLLHDVSHELRSPLGRIQVMTETIGLHPDEATECIHGIGEEIALLDRLVGDLVDTARIESESPSARPERFSLLGWSSETLRRLGSKACPSQIGWTSRLPQQDLEVFGDPQRLAQAVGNLVDNAITALEGRPDARIEVTVAVGADEWSIAVEDNGHGIPSDDLPHVFRRFYRVDSDRRRDRGGVGLGLSLVRAITEALGGEASIESEAGEGTTVSLRFPICDQASRSNE
jgi:signal transduction histidine kinase